MTGRADTRAGNGRGNRADGFTVARDALPALVRADHAARVRAALDALDADHRGDALLVTDLVNIRWITGFTGSAARLLVLPDELLFVTDGRYGDQAAAELHEAGVEARIVVERTVPAQLAVLADAAHACSTVGLEAAHVSWAEQRALAGAFAPALVPTVDVVEALRLVKAEPEVARIELACDIASAALANVLHHLMAEPTEEAFGLALDTEMRYLGAEGPSFDTIVAAGPNGALPHHRPSARRIVAGDTVVLDFGALVDGYHSDMTRTAVLGELPARLAEAVEVVTAAQAAGVAAVRPGISASEVDRACREHIAAAGLGEWFNHGTGHGVGLRIHEAPWLNATSTDLLVAGAVITVEPGVYLVGFGGVRVEDALLVTASGSRPLTKTPKDLSWLPSPPTT